MLKKRKYYGFNAADRKKSMSARQNTFVGTASIRGIDDKEDYVPSSPSASNSPIDGPPASNLRRRDATSCSVYILIRSQDTPVVVSKANLTTSIW
jgi:hypothetical protein